MATPWPARSDTSRSETVYSRDMDAVSPTLDTFWTHFQQPRPDRTRTNPRTRPASSPPRHGPASFAPPSDAPAEIASDAAVSRSACRVTRGKRRIDPLAAGHRAGKPSARRGRYPKITARPRRRQTPTGCTGACGTGGGRDHRNDCCGRNFSTGKLIGPQHLVRAEHEIVVDRTDVTHRMPVRQLPTMDPACLATGQRIDTRVSPDQALPT